MAGNRRTLSSPLHVGSVELSHRLVMAPMTRLRSSESHVPLEMVKTYYSQRATVPGTLLITEATFINSNSRGRDQNAPGIFTDEQIQQWRSIVDAVHENGERLLCSGQRDSRDRLMVICGKPAEVVQSSRYRLRLGELLQPSPWAKLSIIEERDRAQILTEASILL